MAVETITARRGDPARGPQFPLRRAGPHRYTEECWIFENISGDELRTVLDASPACAPFGAEVSRERVPTNRGPGAPWRALNAGWNQDGS
jgi:hypothetical protein